MEHKDEVPEPKKEAPKQEPVHKERDWFTKVKPSQDPDHGSEREWSGSGWSGDRVRGTWGGGRQR
jgi:hypothetical protein